MRILALESSSTHASCALWLDGVLTEHAGPAQAASPAAQSGAHSEALLPQVRALLATAGIGFTQLDGIAFGTGPGAFTGLRVACAAAQGFAMSADLPVLPVGSLEALAWPGKARRILTMTDARMGEIYTAAYLREADGLTQQGEIRVLAPGLLDWPEGDWLVRGNALAAYPQLAEQASIRGWKQEPEVWPQAAAVAEIGALMRSRGQGLDPALAVPVYVRNKVAQTVAERLALGGKA